MSGHRKQYRKWKSKESMDYYTVFKIFETYGVENCKIELIEAFPCSNKCELSRQEGKHIQQEPCVNRFVAGRTIREYEETRKEARKEYARRRHEANKEERNAKSREYHWANREKILERKKMRELEKRPKETKCNIIMSESMNQQEEKQPHMSESMNQQEEKQPYKPKGGFTNQGTVALQTRRVIF